MHHLGVVMPPLPALPRPASNRLIGVGRFVPKKGFADAIAALRIARANGSDLTLDLIGDGPLRDELQSAAQGLPVRFLGWMNANEVAAAMAQALALVAPSKVAKGGNSEGLPRSFSEARPASCPVLSTRHAGIPEAVTDGQTGILVGEADTAALARAMTRIDQESNLPTRLAIGGCHSRCEAEFDPSGISAAGAAAPEISGSYLSLVPASQPPDIPSYVGALAE